ncbi:MAG: hypothetical protein WBM03_06215 [Steroidobacteraceae bacterium]
MGREINRFLDLDFGHAMKPIHPTSGMDQRLTPALMILVMPINRCVSASDMTIDSSTLTYSKGVIQHQEVSWNSSRNSAPDETTDIVIA